MPVGNEVDGGMVDGQRVRERDQLRGLLGGGNASQPRHAKDIPLGDAPFQDGRQGFGLRETMALAVAVRMVGTLALTSTMIALP